MLPKDTPRLIEFTVSSQLVGDPMKHMWDNLRSKRVNSISRFGRGVGGAFITTVTRISTPNVFA